MRRAMQVGVMCAVLLGCAPKPSGVFDGVAPTATLRQIQSRTFETADKTRTMRTVIETLQDLGFAVDKADGELGTISGLKLDGVAVRMTVTVFPQGDSEMLVRANAQYNVAPIVAAQPYEKFFGYLEKAMFVAAEEVR